MRKDVYHGEPVKFDPHYVAKVLEKLPGKQHGCKVTITLTAKEPTVAPPDGGAGG